MISRFGTYTLDPQTYDLRCDGKAVPAEPQVFSLLVHLLENRDRVVSRDELIETVWKGRIVSDATLSSRISAARHAVGDTGDAQAVIQTIARRGIRFVAPVQTDKDGQPDEDGPVDGNDPERRAGQPPASEMQTGSGEKPVVAVLPFDNMSGDPDQEYFADGITEDIITALSKHRWLRVVARNSTFGYKGQSPDIRRVGTELGANYVVEGSVRRSSQRVRITAQLIDAVSGDHLWAERYDRDLEDMFDLQDEITDTIVGRLEPELGAAERHRVERKGRTTLKAWDCYHLGVAHFYRFTAGDNLEAQRLLKQSSELDPNFGDARAWWAYAAVLGMVYWDIEPSEALLDEALTEAQKALALDDQNAVFYMLTARVNLARCDYAAALSGNEAAIRLNPTFAAAYCALGDSLAYEGRYEESLTNFEKAIALSPNDPQRWAFLTYGALAMIFKGDFETALSWTQRARVIPNCQYWTTAHMAVSLACLGRMDEAADAVARLLQEKPDFGCTFAERKLFYIKRPEQKALYLEGLRKAGVPE